MLQKISKTLAISAAMLLLCFSLVTTTYAAVTPTVSATYTANGVMLTGTGNPNTAVYLDYMNSTSAGNQSSIIGSTDSNGNFSATVSSTTYNITPGSSFSVSIDGANSTNSVWPNNTNTSGVMTFSPASVTVNPNQTEVVTLTNSLGGTFSISSNSSSSIASATISGNQLSVTGTTPGTTNITVCSSVNTSSCSSIAVTVAGTGTSTYPISLGQTSITLTPGQSYSIPITGAGSYSVTSNTNSGIASASISGNSIVGSGIANGTTSINVCQGGTSFCIPLSVSVIGTATAPVIAPVATPLQVTVNLAPGQVSTFSLSGGTTPYVISSTPTSAIATAYLSGTNMLTLLGVTLGQTSVTVCANGTTSCAAFGILVSPSTDGSTTTGSGSTTSITTVLRSGSTGSNVSALQQKLTALGMFSGTIDGDFGPLTMTAVEQYQTSKGLTADGIVGPMTMASLNG